MLEQAQLSASFLPKVQQAADIYALHLTGADTANAGLSQRIAEAVVARLLSRDAETVKGASQWVGEAIPKDHRAKNTTNAYRSALAWKLDNATVTRLRAMVTPEAAENEHAFALVAIAAAESLGNYWADYKASRKKVEPPPAASAEGFTGKSDPAPEVVSNAPEVDEVMGAMTSALDAVAFLKSQEGDDARDALNLVLDAVREALGLETQAVEEKAAA